MPPLQGESTDAAVPGVLGENRGTGGRGVVGNGFDATGIGVLGQNDAGDAVFGNSRLARGVVGISNSQAGVVGESQHFDGVFGVSRNANTAGVSGHNLNPNGSPNPGGLGGFFEPNVIVNGTVTAHDVVLSQSDCATRSWSSTTTVPCDRVRKLTTRKLQASSPAGATSNPVLFLAGRHLTPREYQ